MAVHQFCRETDIVGHYHIGRLLIFIECRSIRQAYPDATLCEQRMPEGIFFIHIQAAGNTYGQ